MGERRSNKGNFNGVNNDLSLNCSKALTQLSTKIAFIASSLIAYIASSQ